MNPHILKTPYDPLKDLTPISMAAVFANVLVVQPSLNVKTVADYVKLARQKEKEGGGRTRAPASAAPGNSRASS